MYIVWCIPDFQLRDKFASWFIVGAYSNITHVKKAQSEQVSLKEWVHLAIPIPNCTSWHNLKKVSGKTPMWVLFKWRIKQATGLHHTQNIIISSNIQEVIHGFWTVVLLQRETVLRKDSMPLYWQKVHSNQAQTEVGFLPASGGDKDWKFLWGTFCHLNIPGITGWEILRRNTSMKQFTGSILQLLSNHFLISSLM